MTRRIDALNTTRMLQGIDFSTKALQKDLLLTRGACCLFFVSLKFPSLGKGSD